LPDLKKADMFTLRLPYRKCQFAKPQYLEGSEKFSYRKE